MKLSLPVFDPDHFEMLVLDEERRLFCIVGPMSNDTSLELQIRQYREAGRQLRCEGPLEAGKTRADHIEEFSQRSGYSHSENLL